MGVFFLLSNNKKDAATIPNAAENSVLLFVFLNALINASG